jgi:hypothetical protein
MELIRLARGQVPLDRAFWHYAVVLGLLVNVVTSFLFLLFMSVDNVFAAVFFGYGVSIPYNLLVVVGVWRAADRETEHTARAGLYRLITLVGAVLLSVT